MLLKLFASRISRIRGGGGGVGSTFIYNSPPVNAPYYMVSPACGVSGAVEIDAAHTAVATLRRQRAPKGPCGGTAGQAAVERVH